MQGEARGMQTRQKHKLPLQRSSGGAGPAKPPGKARVNL